MRSRMARRALPFAAAVWALALGTAQWPSEAAAQGVAVEGGGSVLYVNPFEVFFPAGVYRIDAVTGAVTELSTANAGSGPALVAPHNVALEASGAIVVVDASFGVDKWRIVRVDPVNGARTIVSDPTTGSGPGFVFPDGLAVGPDGSLFVNDAHIGSLVPGAVLRVDPVSGDRTIVS